jgi:hypothetical protein
VLRAKAFLNGYNPSGESSASFSVVASQTGNVVYIAPYGSDSNPGDSSQPLKTWAVALKRLAPGGVLVAKQGTYGYAAGNGYPNIDCTAGYKNGTADRPITVRAEIERTAFIDNNGAAAGTSFTIRNCSHWKVEGLRIKNDDYNDGSLDHGTVLGVINSSNITLRRLLLYKNNRYKNSQVLALQTVNNSLLEENEVYWFHRHGILLGGGGKNNTIRRNYVNSRFVVDLENSSTTRPPYKSVEWQWGDSCFVNYPSSDNVFENNICENTGIAFDTIATNSSNSARNEFLGNIAINVSAGAYVSPQTPFSGTYPADNYFENHAVIGLGQGKGNGFGGYSINTRCVNCTFIGLRWGLLVRRDTDWPAKDAVSFACINCFALRNTSGFVVYDHKSWSITYAWAYNNSVNFYPDESYANVTGESISDPKVGACKVFIPDGSPLNGTGLQGIDRGANVLYRYHNGVQLPASPDNRVWDVVTGAFRGQGEKVAGINDIAGSSLFDVHMRLGVNNGGCSLPAGY